MALWYCYLKYQIEYYQKIILIHPYFRLCDIYYYSWTFHNYQSWNFVHRVWVIPEPEPNWKILWKKIQRSFFEIKKKINKKIVSKNNKYVSRFGGCDCYSVWFYCRLKLSYWMIFFLGCSVLILLNDWLSSKFQDSEFCVGYFLWILVYLMDGA